MTEIRVRGFATEDVDPDFAVVHVAATARADSAAEAKDAAGRIADAVRSALLGVEGVRSLRLPRRSLHEDLVWDEAARTQVPRGWVAQLAGTCETQASVVSDVVEALVSAGAEIGYVEWRLETDNSAHRRVRVAAVADARRAADDFASAAGRPLGELLTLADPGLLGGPPAARGEVRVAMASGMSAEAVQVDQDLVTVSATVEACYQLA